MSFLVAVVVAIILPIFHLINSHLSILQYSILIELILLGSIGSKQDGDGCMVYSYNESNDTRFGTPTSAYNGVGVAYLHNNQPFVTLKPEVLYRSVIHYSIQESNQSLSSLHLFSHTSFFFT